MKVKTLTVLAGSLLLAGSAQAAYTGIAGELYSVGGAGPGQTTWHGYVTFNNPMDQLTVVWGNQEKPLNITTPGLFYQNIYGGDIEPSAALIVPFASLEFDSFATIGNWILDAGEAGTSLAPSYNPWGTGPNFQNNSGWYRIPTDPFTYAVDMGGGMYGVGFLSATTDNPLGQVNGLINISVVADGVAGDVTDIAFEWIIPSPGALALLGLAGLVGRRRR